MRRPAGSICGPSTPEPTRLVALSASSFHLPNFPLLRGRPASGSNTILLGEPLMDAYIYRAALWCGPCVIKALVAARRAAPGAIDMSPADALQKIASANGFTSESDYDSDDLPKGPITEGGGEADTPRHCEGCGQFLANPLTSDGLIWAEDVIRNYLTARKASGATTDTVNKWVDF